MVALEASKDACNSLANPPATTDGDDVLIRVPIGVEASVGFYEAIDIATEESIAAPLPVVEPAQVSPAEGGSTANREKNASTNAAAISASIFVGALLWANRCGRSGANSGTELSTAIEVSA